MKCFHKLEQAVFELYRGWGMLKTFFVLTGGNFRLPPEMTIHHIDKNLQYIQQHMGMLRQELIDLRAENAMLRARLEDTGSVSDE